MMLVTAGSSGTIGYTLPDAGNTVAEQQRFGGQHAGLLQNLDHGRNIKD